MLPYEQYAVHGQLGPAKGQRVGDRWKNRQGGEARRPVSAQIAIGLLVHVQRDQVHRRPVVPAVPAVTLEKAVTDVLGRGSICGTR